MSGRELAKVASAARKVALSREALAVAMREARANGESLRAVASAAGVSHETARKLTS